MASGNEPQPSPGSQPPDKLMPGLPSYPTGFRAAPPPRAPEPPPPSDAIPLPPSPAAEQEPPAPRLTPEEAAQLAFRLDRFMVPLVLALAFLLACFAISNSDFFMHLATGRFLADSFRQGQFQNLFGHEPFSHTTEGVYWVNHSWLFDLILYGLFLVVGGVGLVILKALVTMALAGVLLLIRRPGQSLWAPAACIGLAVLALSPRLLFQPPVVSFLFLGVTLWLLTRRETGGPGVASCRHLWLLPLLFVLWVNMDSWFVLGPLTVALYLVGEWLQDSFGPARAGPDAPPPLTPTPLPQGAGERGEGADERRTLVGVLVVGLLACLINPHHVRAFMVPPQLPLVGPASVLQGDPGLQAAYASPLQAIYFERHIGLSVAGMSYFALVLLSLVSFALNGGPGSSPEATGWRWWRGLLWLAFFLLSAYHARAIPFFAVVAGPISVLNLQDFAARTFGTAPRVDERWRVWSLGGRAVTLLVGIGLLALAWPGWLQAVPHEFRRVSLGLTVDPSLKKVAETLCQWRREGKLSAHDRGLNLTPDAANYFAWYCPEEKGFFDHRTQPFAHAVKDYVELREALMPAPEEVDEAVQQMQQEVIRGEPFPRRADLPWQKIFRARGIKYVLVHRMPHRVARWMLADPRQWTPLYLDGRVMILGWTDPAAPAPGATPFPELRFDPARLAFGPPGVATEAPAQGPEQPLQPPPREWWERYLRAAAPASLHADEVEMLLRYFEWQSQAHLVRLSWVGHCSFAAGLVGAAVPMPGPTAMPGLVACRLRFADDLLRGYFARHDDGPPGVLWLAVRAGRKALAENPNDPIAYLRLYRAYAMLQQHTRERSWADRMPLLRAVRRAQMMYCLKRAVTLNPDLAEAHATLAEMYRRMGFGDLALKHLDEFIRVIRHGGAAPQEPSGEFEERLKQVEADRDQLAEQVKKAQDEFLVGSAKMTQTLEKARFARDLGLPEEALKVLTPTIQQLSPEEAQFTLRLLVDLGELDVLRDVLTDKLSDLGLVRHEFQLLPAYEWFQVQLAAASGDYQRADELLQTIEDRFREQLLTLLGRHAQLFVLEPPALPMVPRVLGILTTRLQRVEAFSVLRQFPFSRPQQGDLVLLRGLLALEQGDTARAAQQIERSLAIAPTADYPSEPAATYFLQQLREQAVKKE